MQRELSTQARAALLPQWQLNATETRDQQDGSRSRTFGSSVSQTLFDLGRLRAWDAERTLESADPRSPPAKRVRHSSTWVCCASR